MLDCRKRNESGELPFAQRARQEAQADPHGVLPVSAAPARARVRKEPLRRGSGAEAARAQPQPHRNSGRSTSTRLSILTYKPEHLFLFYFKVADAK